MKERIDPKQYGLSPQTVLMRSDSNEFILVMNRKSRIIMKDALIILKKVETIKQKVQNACVTLEINAPICSKSIKYLNENGIDIKT